MMKMMMKMMMMDDDDDDDASVKKTDINHENLSCLCIRADGLL